MTYRQELSPKNLENLNSEIEGIELLFNKKKSIASSDIGSVKALSMKEDFESEYNSETYKPEIIECNDDTNQSNNEDNVEYEENIQIDEKYQSDIDEDISVIDSEKNSIQQKNYHKQKISNEENIYNAKREILYQFERLEKRGHVLPKKFSLSSSYEEMKFEFNRIKRDIKLDSAIKFQRKVLMTTVNGIEILNNNFNPIGAKLNGWSNKVYEDLDDYDDIFEELYDKYKGKTQIPPEIRLLMSLSGSAFIYHMSNSFSNQLPGLSEILKNNPDIAQKLAGATAEHMANQQSSANNLFGNLGNMVSGLFNKNSNNERPNMRGPTSINDILKSNNTAKSVITNSDDEELEIQSTISEIMNSITSSKKNKKKSITLDI